MIYYAILVPPDVDNVCRSEICGDNFVKGASGTVYKTSWSTVTIPDSETHINITTDQLPAIAAQLPTLGKSVAISGIDDPEAFMAAYGLVRCDKDGNEFTGGEE
jgi:hypothetical protein